jgi:hypothetical protein
MTHGIHTLRYNKSAHETVARCKCGRFEVTIPGNKVKEAAGHLSFHLRKHGADQ